MQGRILALRRAMADAGLPARRTWRLRWLPICASTETELERWLVRHPPEAELREPRVVLARRQRFGRGQHGRTWHSPAGGVWLSAALPWPADAALAAAPGLAVAVALAETLRARDLPVRLKWPNDLLLCGEGSPRKLAGLLPGLRLRGARVRWARIGIGLNGRNPVPIGAANLRPMAALRHGEPLALAALVLQSLERAMLLAADGELVRRRAEALLAPVAGMALEEGWRPAGLTVDGGLRLVHSDGRERILRRF